METGNVVEKEMDELLEDSNKETVHPENKLIHPFYEILKMDDLYVQKALHKITKQQLCKALKAVDTEVQKKIHKNMSKRASTMLREDMEFMGPVRIKDVKEAQKNILLEIYRLVNMGEVSVPEDFYIPEDLDLALEYFFPTPPVLNDKFTIKEFETFLTTRQQIEQRYGYSFHQDVPMCRFFSSSKNEKFLADIQQKNKEQGMGNIKIPNTKIKLINYSICPNCKTVFSFKELTDYYANPKPDESFKNRAEQYRQDTRVLCHECSTYFLPALVIVDGTPKNEVQFLCRVQTANAIETFYAIGRGRNVLSKKKNNIIKKENTNGEAVTAIRNDVLLIELTIRPTLISNLLQYTPANLAINLLDGSNYQKGDVLFGAWT